MGSSDNDSNATTGRHSKLVGPWMILACLTVAALVAGSAMAKPTTATNTQAPDLQKDVDALVAAGVPGAILVVRHGGRTVRLAGGLADVARKRPMHSSDRFRIASLTKSYVATVALQLVAERQLALDDSVEQRLPGVVPNGGKIRIRQLLNHTSGLFDFAADPRVLKPYLKGNFGFRWAPRKLVQIGVSHKPLFAPGTRFAYSNTDYVILGLIVEAVTGNSLGTELGGRIFRPLGLRATAFPTKPRIASPYAHGYYVFAKPPATDVSGVSPFPWAAGAMVSTGADVLSFYRALLAGDLLEPKLLNAMKKTVSEGRRTDIPGSRYGLGLERFPTSCGGAWGHNGAIAGYLVFAFTSNDGGGQAVLMVNEDGSSLTKRGRLALLQGDRQGVLRCQQAAMTGVGDISPSGPENTRSLEWPASCEGVPALARAAFFVAPRALGVFEAMNQVLIGSGTRAPDSPYYPDLSHNAGTTIPRWHWATGSLRPRRTRRMGYPTIRSNRHRDRARAASLSPTAHSHDLTRRAAHSGRAVLLAEPTT
jgi:D-alanyl-D-alanine carboxypeptidase